MGSLVTAYAFAPGVVRRLLLDGCPGAYALGHLDGLAFVPGYVGRSDASVRQRLATHERLGEFDYVTVRYAADAEAAFAIECELWHGCRDAGLPLVNLIHPASPRAAALVCPYCDFARQVRRLLSAA